MNLFGIRALRSQQQPEASLNQVMGGTKERRKTLLHSADSTTTFYYGLLVFLVLTHRQQNYSHDEFEFTGKINAIRRS